MSTVPTVLLEDAMDAIIDYRGKTPPKSDEGVWLVTAKVVKGGFIRESPREYIPTEAYDAWMRRGLPRLGDVLITTEAPLGEVAAIRSTARIALAQRLILLRANPEKLDQDFLLYSLQTPGVQSQLRARATGTTVTGIKQSELRRIRLPAPAIVTQRAVGAALRAIDDLIENNRRRVETLEEMARLIYREWFVHFRFPGHEDVELVDSDLGPIPEGWKIKSVGDVARLVRGRTYRRTELVEAPDGLPFLNLKCIDRGGGFRKSGLKRYAGPFKPEQQALAGDTVIAVTDMTQERNIVGQAGRVPVMGEGSGVISLDLVRALPRDVNGDYLYGTFRYSDFSTAVREHANGTNVLHLSPNRIRDYRFPAAPSSLQTRFHESTRPMYDLVESLQRQSEALAQARGLLLPRLISGELDVSDLDLEPAV